MQVTGMLHGAKVLQFVGFPTAEVLGPGATEDEIKGLIDRHGSVFIKPVFKGGIGKKGKSGLLGRATDVKGALAEKERLYFVEHRVGNVTAKANGVTFEGAVPAEHEVYFSITDSTHFRAPTMTLTHRGGVAIEELDRSELRQVPFDPLTGLKSFVVANALSELNAPHAIVSPLVQQLPKLWELFHDYGMTTLELNPIRMRPDRGAGSPRSPATSNAASTATTRAGSAWACRPTCSPSTIPTSSRRSTELRTYQGQSDVYVINPAGTILAPTFGGGANSLVTEMLGDSAIISSDFGGNPPYEKMKEVAAHLLQALADADQRAVHHRRQGEQHRHLRDLPRHGRCVARALQRHGPTPLYRGGGPRRAEPGARPGRAARHRSTRSACPTASSASIRT